MLSSTRRVHKLERVSSGTVGPRGWRWTQGSCVKRNQRASTALALSLLVGPSGAKVLPAQTENPRFEHLSLEQGLSQGTVQSMLQDRQGFMWFATLDGLNQYDGYGFVVYRPDLENPDSLSDSVIQDIHEDSAGVL